ncbi:MAG: hypothetical protein HZA19_05290 [Nitrospirae bacterium]|nr:hypothetical protein [Nitrospirota bacterium]
MTIRVERRGERSGYQIRTAPKGYIYEMWTRLQGSFTHGKYLIPYALVPRAQRPDEAGTLPDEIEVQVLGALKDPGVKVIRRGFQLRQKKG